MISINKTIDVLKDTFNYDVLECLEHTDCFEKNIEHVLDFSFDDEVEGFEILNILRDELLLEKYFSRDRINSFKSNPEKYASAKCISSSLNAKEYKADYNPVVEHDISMEYVLLKNHKNTFMIFYMDERFSLKTSCLLMITEPQYTKINANTFSLQYNGRLSIFELCSN